jgi:hypothetical protein
MKVIKLITSELTETDFILLDSKVIGYYGYNHHQLEYRLLKNNITKSFCIKDIKKNASCFTLSKEDNNTDFFLYTYRFIFKRWAIFLSKTKFSSSLPFVMMMALKPISMFIMTRRFTL